MQVKFSTAYPYCILVTNLLKVTNSYLVYKNTLKVGDLRFELRTNRLRVYCSTVELVTHTNNDYSRLLTN